MIKRIVDISQASQIAVRHSQLQITQAEQTTRIPIEDIGALILAHYAITLSSAVIARCQANNVVVVVCDRRMLPCSVILPVFSENALHSKILRCQIATTRPRQKRLWQQIVQHKLREQAHTLKTLGRPASVLDRLSQEVLSEDKQNTEAQGAQYYWKQLFGTAFRRDTEATNQSVLLNYGYAIARSMVARTICGAGLHPTIGIHHHNQANALCLADDLMEPLRPWIDYLVVRYVNTERNVELSTKFKRWILQFPAMDVSYAGRLMPLMVSLHYVMADFKRGLEENAKLTFPKWDKRRPIQLFSVD